MQKIISTTRVTLITFRQNKLPWWSVRDIRTYVYYLYTASIKRL